MNNGIWTTYEYFLRLPLSVTPIWILPVSKILKDLGGIQFIAKFPSIYTKFCLRHKHKTFWRIGGISRLQLLSRTYFAKIEDKKVMRKISSKNLTAEV